MMGSVFGVMAECSQCSDQMAAPTEGATILIGHDAVKLPIALKDQGKEVAIPLPQWEIVQTVDFDPFQPAFGVLQHKVTVRAVDAEDKAKPVFAVAAEPRPAYGAPKHNLQALDVGFLLNLAAHATDDVLALVQFASQAVVLAKVGIGLPLVTMHQQHLFVIG